MAEVGFVLSMAFFIKIVVTPIRKDEDRARVAASIKETLVKYVDRAIEANS